MWQLTARLLVRVQLGEPALPSPLIMIVFSNGSGDRFTKVRSGIARMIRYSYFQLDKGSDEG